MSRIHRLGLLGLVCMLTVSVSAAADEEFKPPLAGVERPPLWEPSAAWRADSDRPYWRRNLFKRFFEDQAYLVTTWWPAESRRVGFSVPMLIVVAQASRSSAQGGGLDLRWQRSIESWSVGGRRRVAEGLTWLGDRDTALMLLGGTYLISRWTGNDRMSRVTSLSAEALMNTGVYSIVLKRLTRRTRPSAGGTGQFFVYRPADGLEPKSFPSGHAMGAFAVAAVFVGEFREKKWVPWVAYGTAGLISLSRVGLGRHFLSDVMGGAVLGHSMGRMVVHRNRGSSEEKPWSRLQPLYNPRNQGFGIAYRHSW